MSEERDERLWGPEEDGDARDAMAALRARSDQDIARAIEVARFYANYYRTLIAEYIPPDHALALTIGLQHALNCGAAHPRQSEEDGE